MKQLSFEAHLQRLRARYARRGKQGKSRLLTECCEQYGYSRKHAIKLLLDRLPKPGRRHRAGAPPRYEPIREVIERIWGAAEQLCGKRLVVALPLWLPHYGKRFGRLLPSQQSLLVEVSAASLAGASQWSSPATLSSGRCSTRGTPWRIARTRSFA